MIAGDPSKVFSVTQRTDFDASARDSDGDGGSNGCDSCGRLCSTALLKVEHHDNPTRYYLTPQCMANMDWEQRLELVSFSLNPIEFYPPSSAT